MISSGTFLRNYWRYFSDRKELVDEIYVRSDTICIYKIKKKDQIVNHFNNFLQSVFNLPETAASMEEALNVPPAVSMETPEINKQGLFQNYSN